jgi:hypothetical protein
MSQQLARMDFREIRRQHFANLGAFFEVKSRRVAVVQSRR